MRDRVANETAFERAKTVIRQLVSAGARRPGTQRFTLLLMSQPDSTYSNLGERDLDEAFVDELAVKLDALEGTHQRVDVVAGLEAAGVRLAGDPAAARSLYVLSDFRSSDWIENPSVRTAIAALAEANVSLSLVRVIDEAHDNLAVTELAGAVEVAAAGIPVELSATVRNFGVREAEDVRLSVTADGEPLARSEVFDVISAGETVQQRLSVRFPDAGKHRVEVSLEADALEADNVRHLAIDVPLENDVLIVEGTSIGDEALYLVDALAADSSVTGYHPVVENVDGMRRRNLASFQSIYLVNVPELPLDAWEALKDFVAGGGGLVWYVGDAVRTAFYNESLYEDGAGLFPVPLASSFRTLEHSLASTGPDLLVEEHPIFTILSGQNNPFIDVVRVNHYYPVDTGGGVYEDDAFPHARVIARLRNREPLILEHSYGDGRVITFLTTAGPVVGPDRKVWNDWAGGRASASYPVMHLELQKYIARRDRSQPRRIVGEPIIERLDRTIYQEDVEIVTPDGEAITLKASAPQSAAGDPAPDAEPEDAELDAWTAVYRDTDGPGVYVVRRFDHQQQVEETWMAYNFPAEESRLSIADDASLRRQLGEDINLTIQNGEALDWTGSEPPSQDVRWWLLGGLLLVLVSEQALALRLGYH
jgi:hypothetical protein